MSEDGRSKEIQLVVYADRVSSVTYWCRGERDVIVFQARSNRTSRGRAFLPASGTEGGKNVIQ